jgi:hypothetical protein
MYGFFRVLLIFGLLTIASTDAVDVSSQRSYPMNPPTSADALWKKVVAFLNKNEGYATKKQFTQTFGIHFGYVEPERTELYRWLYRTVLSDRGRLRELVRKYHLDPA